MRTALVTDQPLLAEGLSAVFEKCGEFQLVAVYTKVAELLNMLPALAPELALIDVGLDASFSRISEMISAAPCCKTVLLTRVPTAEMTYHAQGTGACALLSTKLPVSELLTCLAQVESGGSIFDYSGRQGNPAAKVVNLTKRESQLVELVSQGLKNKEIAGLLGISEGTVKTYLSKLFQKVGANDRLELALFGLKNASGWPESKAGRQSGETTRRPTATSLKSPVLGPKSLFLAQPRALRLSQR